MQAARVEGIGRSEEAEENFLKYGAEFIKTIV